MDNIIIAIILISYLITQKIETNVSNEHIKLKISSLHLKVKNHFEKIVATEYNNASREAMGKWLSFIFIFFAIINFISISIFGNGSENAFLNNRGIILVVGAIFFLTQGSISSKRDLLFPTLLIFIVGIVLTWTVLNGELNPYLSQEFNIQAFIIICILIMVFSCIFLLFVYHFLLKEVSKLFYKLLQKYLKFCLFLNSKQPLKPFGFIIELMLILIISIISVVKM